MIWGRQGTGLDPRRTQLQERQHREAPLLCRLIQHHKAFHCPRVSAPGALQLLPAEEKVAGRLMTAHSGAVL